MTNLEIVNKLIGNIHPAGSSEIDAKRFENLKEMCELVDDLIMQLQSVAGNKNRIEWSMKEMGQYADKFLKTLISDPS